MSKWDQVRTLPADERWLLIEALVLLPLIELLLRIRGMQQTQHIAGYLPQAHPTDPAIISQQIDRAARLYGLACLSRSLTLWTMLKRRGIHSNLRLGVQKGRSFFQAHTWIEIDGSPVNTPADVSSQFVAF